MFREVLWAIIDDASCRYTVHLGCRSCDRRRRGRGRSSCTLPPPVLKAADVEEFLHSPKICVKSFVNGSSRAFSTITAGHTSYASPDHRSATATHPSHTLDWKSLQSLSTNIVSFLRIESTTIASHTSFVILGHSSLQAISLTKNLSDSGFAVSVTKLAEKIEEANSSAGAEEEGEGKRLEELKEKLAKGLGVEALKLDEGDVAEITPCRALQSGMLSQVRRHLLPNERDFC